MDSPDIENCATPSKKRKRLCNYLKQWENEFSWLSEDKTSESSNLSKGFCSICRKSFLVAYGGKSDVKKHELGADHKKKSSDIKQNQLMLTFFPDKDKLSSKDEKLIAAEVTNVYHTVNHSHSYNSLNCSAELASTIYNDSEIAKSLRLGRTKASSIAFNALAPASLESPLAVLKTGIYFSISTDASNHGSSKLYPILLRYYIPSEGIKLCLLDFFEDPNESANDIFKNLKTRIKTHGLEIEKISSYSADNANVNFGCNHSVYTLLSQENPNIIKSGCPAHMVNNSVRNSLEKCKFDLENLVLKIYSHFSSQAKRTKELKEFFEFVDLEYKSILRHVPTRWLSLYPAVDRLVKIFPALKSYFLSLDEEACPESIKLYLSDEVDGIESIITECYLTFFHNVLKLIYETEQKLQQSNILCFEVFEILTNLRTKLIQRIEDKFLGFMCSNLLKNLPAYNMRIITQTCIKFYRDVLNYLESHFDFSENNQLSKLNIFSLTEVITYQDLMQIVNDLGITDSIDMDLLHEEFSSIKESIRLLAASENTSPIEKWTSIFKLNPGLKNVLTIVQFVFSIFGSNADAERIFSMCSASWTNTRNRLTVDHIKAELQIKVNYSENCQEFYSKALKNRALLQAAKSEKKYSFKMK